MMRRSRKIFYRRWARWAMGLFVCSLIVWLVGFFMFAQKIPDRIQKPNKKSDAIVVLTGGTLRLETGLELLSQKQATKLFVSGVHRGVDVRQLLGIAQKSPHAIECCIALGYDANNTEGNARETAAWLNKERFESIRLVTASYHMPRSLVEFRSVMRNIEIMPHPVFPKSFKAKEWWLWPGSTGLIMEEYNKYLLAIFRRIFMGPVFG